MALRASLQVLVGTTRRRRTRVIAAGLGLALAATSLTGCTVSSGSAVLVGGNTVSEKSVQLGSAAFMSENPTAATTNGAIASYNRAQISYQVRHALIAKALTAKGIVITDADLTAAEATLKSQSQGASLAASLGLPASDEQGVVHDLVAIEELVKGLPATGAPVQDVSVTAEGVPAATRDEAVALRSKYIADPAAMDTASAAAGAKGVPKTVYNLLQSPAAGSAGLFQPSTGAVSILSNSTGWLVLRTTDRAVKPTALTQASFSNAQNTSDVLNIGALLLVPYEDAAGISVNPRYGVWDPASVQVVPGNDGL